MKKINWSKIEDGTECVATIKGFPVKSKIRKYGGKIYLCQNLFSGSTPLDGNLLGYNFSWTMNDGSLREMSKDYCQVSEISFDKKKIKERYDFVRFTNGNVAYVKDKQLVVLKRGGNKEYMSFDLLDQIYHSLLSDIPLRAKFSGWGMYVDKKCYIGCNTYSLEEVEKAWALTAYYQ